MHHYLKFKLPVGYDQGQLIRELPDHCAIQREQSIIERFAIYDTFDWRLFNKSLVLYGAGSNLVLHQLSENAIIQSAKITSQPAFIWDFPDGKLKELLSAIIKMRALLKLAEIHSQSTPYRVLNSDEKTVARFVYEEIRRFHKADTPTLSVHLALNPVRGYRKYARRLTNQFKEMGFPVIKEEGIFVGATQLS